MSYITWIIIWLIVISIIVTTTEALLRFVMLKKGGPNSKAMLAPFASISWARDSNPHDVPELLVLSPPALSDRAHNARTEGNQESVSELEMVAVTLGLQSNATLADVINGIRDVKRVAELKQHCGAEASASLPAGSDETLN